MDTLETVGDAGEGDTAAGERVMETAQKIMRSMNASEDETNDMLLIFSSFDNRLSKITDLVASDAVESHSQRVDERLDAAEKVILSADYDSDFGVAAAASDGQPVLLWEDSPDEAIAYLSAVDEVLKLTEELSIHPKDGGCEVSDRAENLLQSAMSRLEDEFRLILIRNTVPLDSDKLCGSFRRVSLSFTSRAGEIIEEDFESFGEDEQPESARYHERGGSFIGDDLSVDLVHPNAVSELKEIADRMIRSGYEKECCQVYSSVRRDVLDECLSVLGVEKISIEEVQNIKWRSLDEKMKKWVQAVKITVMVLLTGERKLCDHVFDGSDLITKVCFNETIRNCIMQLLNFGEAVTIGKRSSEKLFRILDMYDAMADVFPHLEALVFNDESRDGDFVYNEAKGVFDQLGEAAKGTFAEFENAVLGETSKKCIQGGDIHPLSRYVMNYIKLLVEYSASLNSILQGVEDESNSNHSPCDESLEDISPLGCRLLALMTTLESNLEEKSKVYDESGMQYIFLMNNIQYIVQKVKDSDLGKLLGDQWIRTHRGQVRQLATSYLRASWTKVLSCLKDDGIGGGSLSKASRVALKEKFKSFNACFEEIYRIQTAWKVPDPQLREELRISISEKVIPAYRSFMGRFGSQLEGGRHAGKYIKYTPEDMENHLSDLFEGSPGVLHNNVRRKSN